MTQNMTRNKRNPQTKTVVIITALLAAAVAALALLNRDSVAAIKEAQREGTFSLRAGDQIVAVTMDDIMALSPFDIEANYKTSGNAAETRRYQGVSLKSVVNALGVDVSGCQTASFTAADGYISALALDEAMDDGNCYIAVAMGNEPLGTKEGGGTGPYMMILAHDPFSQRWCKFLLEVRFQ